MEAPIEDQPFDWTFSLPPQPDNDFISGDYLCETKRFDAFWSSTGTRLFLPAGQKPIVTRDARAEQSALVVTTYYNVLQNIENTELKIKLPHMKAALKAVVPQYSSFSIEARHITITGPPRCLFHYRQELVDYGAALLQQPEAHQDAARHILHLISYMWEVFTAEILAFSSCDGSLDEPFLQYEYLWMVFRSGDLVYVREPFRQAFIFEEISSKGTSWELSGRYIDSDGDAFHFVPYSASIAFYDGIKPLRELLAVRFDHLQADEQQAVKERLLTRGRKFVGIHGQQHLWYNAKSQKALASNANGRFMADRQGFDDIGPGDSQNVLDHQKRFKPENALEEMTENDLMVCRNTVAGYSLRSSSWGRFDVDSISDVTFDSNAFDALVLPSDQKQQIPSLVRVHENDGFSFDDLVKGKGKGMVFLLYGDPGVGKTLTAESVADYCQRPLLRMDAGTLGTSSSSVESGLTHTFSLAERWHALLLLDEADVYLEQRKTKNLIHNGIVSVFLRMIEYYHGILFLTTNRVNSFDKAFKSRIHLAIHYPALIQSTRRTLLYTFLSQVSKDSAEVMSHNGALNKLAEEQLDGRQIKNLVRTACALAFSEYSKGGLVEPRHLELALRPMKQFDKAMEQDFLDKQRDLIADKNSEGKRIVPKRNSDESSDNDVIVEDQDEENEGLNEDDESDEEGLDDDPGTQQKWNKRRRLDF